MKLTKSQLKEMIREELKEANFDKFKRGVVSQENIGNIFITKHDGTVEPYKAGDITFHIKDTPYSRIWFNSKQAKQVLQKLKKIGV